MCGSLLPILFLTDFPFPQTELGNRLIYCFESPSGIPYPWINLKTLHVRDDYNIAISEAASIQLEFRSLSQSTKNKTYEEVR